MTPPLPKIFPWLTRPPLDPEEPSHARVSCEARHLEHLLAASGILLSMAFMHLQHQVANEHRRRQLAHLSTACEELEAALGEPNAPGGEA